MAAALAAVVLRLAALRRPGADVLGALDRDRGAGDPGVGRAGGAGPLLAAVAVAVAGELERRPHLEADRAAAAAAVQRGPPARRSRRRHLALAPRAPAAPEGEEDDRDDPADLVGAEQHRDRRSASRPASAPSRVSLRSAASSTRAVSAAQPIQATGPVEPAPGFEEALRQRQRQDHEEDADRDQLHERGAPEQGGVHQRRRLAAPPRRPAQQRKPSSPQSSSAKPE